MIARHFRILLQLHDPEIRSLDPRSKAQTLGIHSFFLKSYEADAKRYSLKHCRNIMAAVGKTDQYLKSSPMSDRLLLERLLFDITL